MKNTTYNYTTVTEYRAPTDDSVRLLHEMETAARNDLSKAIKLDSNIIKGQIQKKVDIMNWKDVYMVAININGTKHLFDVEVDPHSDKWDKATAIYSEIAKYLAAHIMPKDITMQL